MAEMMMTTLLTLMLLGVAFHRTEGQLTYPSEEASPCPKPFSKVGEECLFVRLAQKGDGRGAPVTWNAARALCQSIHFATDLAIVERSETLSALYDHVAAQYPNETSKGWTYWVGGFNDGGSEWRWIDEEKINLRSHIWLPSAPVLNSPPANTLLVPANQQHGRFYLSQNPRQSVAPAYVCENLPGLRPFGSPL